MVGKKEWTVKELVEGKKERISKVSGVFLITRRGEAYEYAPGKKSVKMSLQDMSSEAHLTLTLFDEELFDLAGPGDRIEIGKALYERRTGQEKTVYHNISIGTYGSYKKV